MNELIDLISSLIKFETISTNTDEIVKCFNFIVDYFKGSKYVCKILDINNQPNLLITESRQLKYDMIFCGHIDVVRANKEMFEPKLINGRLYGRGAIDMKSQIAIFLSFLKKYNGGKKICTILTSDEEIGSKNGIEAILKQFHLKSKLAFIPDCGNNFNLVKAGQGVIKLDLTIFGKKAHSAYFNNGENAIEKFFNLFCLLKKNIKKYDNTTTINIANIESNNEKYNIVPSVADIKLDLRFYKGLNISHLTRFFDNDIKYKVVDYVKSFYNKNNIYFKKINKFLNKQLNRKVKPIIMPASTEARFFTDINIPTICINPIGDGAHTENEFCDINSLRLFDKLIEKLVQIV